ncbi:hypothetical protein [Paramagnetospirillum magneticum]|nr:hypothetical protein [Paramagnetospirillum magneticum]
MDQSIPPSLRRPVMVEFLFIAANLSMFGVLHLLVRACERM